MLCGESAPPSNWVDILRGEITRIAKSHRGRFIRACVRLITVQHRPIPGAKVSPPLGLGPDDFLRVCINRLREIDPPSVDFRQFNPFKDLFLEEDLPKNYLLYQSRRELIVKTIFLVKLGYELYQGLTETLQRIGVPVYNTKFTLHHLRFEIFRKGIIPFVITTAELLKRLDLLHADLEGMYQEFTQLCHFFKDSVLDEGLALPIEITNPMPLQLTEQQVA